jgi:predicted RNase H-like HicB family nuclease
MMEYTVLIHPAEEGGYWTEVPALSGCYSQGETVEEALANTREAIEVHLAALREEGEKEPGEDGLLIGRVEVAAGQGRGGARPGQPCAELHG